MKYSLSQGKSQGWSSRKPIRNKWPGSEPLLKDHQRRASEGAHGADEEEQRPINTPIPDMGFAYHTIGGGNHENNSMGKLEAVTLPQGREKRQIQEGCRREPVHTMMPCPPHNKSDFTTVKYREPE